MTGVNDLVRRWRDFALRDVPKEYSERGLTQKFLRSDCAEGGAWDAADELEDVAHTAWHPVSEPPTEHTVIVYDPTCGVYIDETADRENFVETSPESALWARIRDVVLLPEDK